MTVAFVYNPQLQHLINHLAYMFPKGQRNRSPRDPHHLSWRGLDRIPNSLDFPSQSANISGEICYLLYLVHSGWEAKSHPHPPIQVAPAQVAKPTVFHRLLLLSRTSRPLHLISPVILLWVLNPIFLFLWPSPKQVFINYINRACWGGGGSCLFQYQKLSKQGFAVSWLFCLSFSWVLPTLLFLKLT